LEREKEKVEKVRANCDVGRGSLGGENLELSIKGWRRDAPGRILKKERKRERNDAPSPELRRRIVTG